MSTQVTTTQNATNPFAGQVAAMPRASAPAQSDQQRAIAEVQAAMMIARANPRDQAAMDRILAACQRLALAEVAVYSYVRGGSAITGPSIRLAEAIAQQWGNLQFGIREIEQRNGESVVQAFAWDVETNVRREMTFSVPHTRHTKRGSYRLEDPRDIYETVANNGARRLRACILAVVPGDVIDGAVAQCEQTMRAKADVSDEAISKMLVAFAEFGVTQEQIEKRIQRNIDAIQPVQVVELKKVYASLRDGMSSVADWFEIESNEDAQKVEKKTVGNQAAKEALSQRKSSQPEKQESQDQTAKPMTPEEIAKAQDALLNPPNTATANILWRDIEPRARATSRKVFAALESNYQTGWNKAADKEAEKS